MKNSTTNQHEHLTQALLPEDEQPYIVPENWVWTRLGKAGVQSQYGYTEKASDEVIGPKFLRITDIQDDYVDWNHVPHCKINDNDYQKYALSINDIVVARTGATTGKSYIVCEEVKAIFASYLIKLTIYNKKLLIPQFLFQFMQSWLYWNQIVEVSSGIAQPGVNANKLKELIFPLPPLAEQQRIVKRIESMFEKLDRAKELAQNALDSFETRKVAILHKAFTGELTAKWREENGVGMDSWEEKRLGDVLLPMTVKKPRGTKFRYIDIDSINNNIQKVEVPKTLPVKSAPSRANREVLEGDTLFSMVRPYLKNIAFIDESLSDCIASTGFYVCRPSNQINPVFLYMFLTSEEIIMKINSFMKGDNSPSVKKEDIEKTEIFLPTLLEQQEIVGILDNLFEKEKRAKELCNVIEKIDLMKKAILARAFRGELGTNDSSEESMVVGLVDGNR